ncbi:hypothetical protein [Janthinobacterium rivuli]|uniref:hypothetical protein n=1 Tax=Janthinobacterium rivuli TaxID=2751478 RepID=UPI00383BE92A
MALSATEQEAILKKQIQDWTKELKRLADLIAAAKGGNCALVMISSTDADYADVAPELILEDVLRVNPHGWPDGFSIDLLNQST